MVCTEIIHISLWGKPFTGLACHNSSSAEQDLQSGFKKNPTCLIRKVIELGTNLLPVLCKGSVSQWMSSQKLPDCTNMQAGMHVGCESWPITLLGCFVFVVAQTQATGKLHSLNFKWNNYPNSAEITEPLTSFAHFRFPRVPNHYLFLFTLLLIYLPHPLSPSLLPLSRPLFKTKG